MLQIGIDQADKGALIPNEEVRAEINQWIKAKRKQMYQIAWTKLAKETHQQIFDFVLENWSIDVVLKTT